MTGIEPAIALPRERIYLITVWSLFKYRMDLNHRDLTERLSQHPGFKVIDFDELERTSFDDCKVLLLSPWLDAEERGGNTWFIVPDRQWVVSNRSDFRLPFHVPRSRIGKFYQDVYQLGATSDIGGQYDFVVLRYDCDFSKSLFSSKPTMHFISHHFDLDVYKKFELKKRYDVIIYGRLKERLYPFRCRVAELLLKHQDQYRILFIPHPGYGQEIGWRRLLRRALIKLGFIRQVRQRALAKRLNESYLSLSVTAGKDGRLDHFFQKYGEATLSFCLVLGNIPQEAKELFGDNYVRIDQSMRDEEILEAVSDALAARG